MAGSGHAMAGTAALRSAHIQHDNFDFEKGTKKMAAIGLSILLIPALALIATLIWSLAVILSTPSETWDAAGLNQWMWLGVVVFLPLIGSVLFLAMGRRQLKAAATIDASVQLSTQ